MKTLRGRATLFPFLISSVFVGTTDAQQAYDLSGFDDLAFGHTIAATITLCENQISKSELHNNVFSKSTDGGDVR